MKLVLRNITKRFGSFVANDRISLTVEPGEVHELVVEAARHAGGGGARVGADGIRVEGLAGQPPLLGDHLGPDALVERVDAVALEKRRRVREAEVLDREG